MHQKLGFDQITADYFKAELNIAAYLLACLEEAPDAEALIAKTLGTVLEVLGALDLRLAIVPQVYAKQTVT